MSDDLTPEVKDLALRDAGIAIITGQTRAYMEAQDQLKPWKNGQAEALLAGYQAVLGETDDGRPRLTVSRWAYTANLDSLEDLEKWLRLVGRRSGAA